MAITIFDGKYSFLSNFYPVQVTLDGLEYPSVEHAYQAAKTLDPSERRKIQNAATSGKAKRLGRELKLRSDWDSIKLGVMRNLLVQKFNNESFRELLLQTGDEELIEGNTWSDKFWGCVFENGTPFGRNELGKILMQIRRSYITAWRISLQFEPGQNSRGPEG